MSVTEIVRSYLIANGFDGLACDDCGCDLVDLFPCENAPYVCKPARKQECDRCPDFEPQTCDSEARGPGSHCYRVQS